jgi:hypothetical protein
MTSYPPIFRLSKEIVLLIFSLCGPAAYADVVASGQNDKWKASAPACCLAVTHVCRLWRAYALSDPLLWTTPLLAWPYLARNMIARSARMPLSVRYPTLREEWECRMSSDFFPASLYAALRDFSRVRSLVLSASARGWTDLLHNFAAPAPNLCTLEMSMFAHNEVWHMPRDIFDGLSPLSSLTELVCTRCIPHLDTPALQHLTSLTLDLSSLDACSDAGEDDTHVHTIPTETVLDILHHTPSLRRLSTRCLSVSKSLSAVYSRTARLPSLQMLHIVDFGHTIGAMLASLEVPADVALDLECCSVHDDGGSHGDEEKSELDKFKIFVKRIHLWLGARSRSLLLRAVFQFQGEWLTLSADDVSASYELIDSSPMLKLKQWDLADASFTHMLHHTVTTLRLHDVTHLVLDIPNMQVPNRELDFRDFVATLRQMDQITQITLCKAPWLVKSLLGALGHGKPDVATRTLGLPCPALRTLRFLRTNVWREDKHRALTFATFNSLLSARVVVQGRKLALLEIDEHAEVPALSSKMTAQRMMRLEYVAERVLVPPSLSRNDCGASEEV